MKSRRLILVLVAFTVLTLGMGSASAVQVTLPGVPEYHWWWGCSPTSGGMLIGYYDGLAGFQNIWDEGSTTVNDMIHTPLDGVDNSVGDFMNTSYPAGGTSDPNIASGMEDYIEWDDPTTAINESYAATTWNEYTHDPEYIEPGWTPGEFVWADFVAEIDAGRPMLLSWGGPRGGHTTLGYGYDDMNSDNPLDWQVIHYTTWASGPAPATWYFDPDSSALNPDNWNLDLGTFVHVEGSFPQTPDAGATFALLASALAGLGILRRRAR